MDFRYIYRTSDGERKEAQIASPSRDEAFAALREQGIRPIKLIALSPETRDGRRGYGKRVIALVALSAAALVGMTVWFGTVRWVSADVQAPARVRNPHVIESNVVELKPDRYVARPLPRKQIPGVLAETAVRAAFRHPSERLLARFACPGRVVSPEPDPSDRQLQADFYEAMDEPIVIERADDRSIVQLKRIVSGMKEEVEVKLNGGATVSEVVSWLVERQKMESAWRQKIVSENPPEQAAAIMGPLGL